MLPLTGTYYDATKKIWNGHKRKDLYNTDLTLGEVAMEQLQKIPNKIIQIMDATGETLTAKELMNYATTLARNLLKWNIKAKDVLGLYAQNTTHVVTVMLASFLCGTPVNALYPGFDRESVSLIYKVTKPKIIFCDIENYENAKYCNDNLNLKALIVLMNGDISGVINVRDLLKCDDAPNANDLQTFKFPCSELKGGDVAVILCSSGTTGTPKGVMCSHQAFLNKITFFTLKSDSVLFSFSTLYWLSGLVSLTISLINGVLRIITDKSFTPEYFLYLVERYKITHAVCGVSQVAEVVFNVSPSIVRKSLASIDTLLCGGSKVPRIVHEKMAEILSNNTERPGFSIAYGMTELTGMISCNGGYPCEFQTEGKLNPNGKVRIRDKQGNYLGPNEQGEIIAESPYNFLGYYNNPETTQKTLIDNWLCTGDIGYFDDFGFLHVCGRDNEVFKSSNFQIYPQIIEDIILRIAGVAEVCVFGIPDLVATNLTACAIVRSRNKNALELTSADVDQHVKDNMAKVYNLKGGVYFVDSLPKTGSGKVQRRKVLDLVNKSIINI